MHLRADRAQLLDHEPPPGRRLQRHLELLAGETLKEPAHASAISRATRPRDTSPVDVSIHSAVICAEPAETAALRGNKQRAKTDRADARHLRELLLAGRLPESWIPPDHILDLRALVRLRHTLSSSTPSGSSGSRRCSITTAAHTAAS